MTNSNEVLTKKTLVETKVVKCGCGREFTQYSYSDGTLQPVECGACRFKRLAAARVNKAIKSMRLICNLAGTQYRSNQEEHNKIETALRNAVDEVCQKLNRTAKEETNAFSFDTATEEKIEDATVVQYTPPDVVRQILTDETADEDDS